MLTIYSYGIMICLAGWLIVNKNIENVNYQSSLVLLRINGNGIHIFPFIFPFLLNFSFHTFVYLFFILIFFSACAHFSSIPSFFQFFPSQILLLHFLF